MADTRTETPTLAGARSKLTGWIQSIEMGNYIHPQTVKEAIDDVIAAAKREQVKDALGLFCVYCYEEYPPGSDVSVLTGHVAKCPNHPMREFVAALKAISDDYERLCGDGLTVSNEPAVLKAARAALAKADGLSDPAEASNGA